MVITRRILAGRIESIHDEQTLQFMEQAFYLIPLGPRQFNYHVLENTHIDESGARALSVATDDCWQAIKERDLVGFGRAVRMAYDAQIAMFPNMVSPVMEELIERYRDQALGWKVSGAGGGGYLILVADHPIENALRIVSRRRLD